MHRGYSLIELLVVMAVLGTLAALAMPMAEITVQRQREQELQRALWEIRDAIDGYRRAVDTGLLPAEPGRPPYPPTLAVLAQGVPVRGGMLRWLRRIPRDPFADARLPPEQTWGLRSYESEAVEPQPGANVYDVYSRSPLVGLNGVALRSW